MKNLLALALLTAPHFLFAQTVITFAGIPNDDPTVNYTSTTKNLDETYFSYPDGLCFDPNGRLWISEHNKIRVILGSQIYLRAGSLGGPTFSEGYKNANGSSATFRNPAGMVTDSDGNIYICDADNHCIRKIAKYVNLGNTQAVSTFAGADPTAGLPGYGTSGSADGTGNTARFDTPRDITRDADGNFYVTDYLNKTIRKITPSGVVTTLAGSAGNSGTADGVGANARFGGPWGIAMYDADHLVVTDQWNTNVRLIEISTGTVTTIAGPTSGPNPSHLDGTLDEAKFKAPKGLVVINGIIYIADQNIIRAVDIDDDEVTTFVGDKSSFGITDGVGENAKFTEISDLATDGSGHIYVAENSGAIASHVIRKVSIDDLVTHADFVAAKRNLAVDEKTSLTDISTGTQVLERLWSISSSAGSVTLTDSSSEIIEVSFPVTGFYTVTLWINTAFGPDTKEVVNYFTVSTSSNSIQSNSNHLVTLYPNPADKEVRIQLAPLWSYTSTTITVYNSEGIAVKELKPGELLQTGELPNGIYYVTSLSGNMFGVQKLLVQH